MTRERFKLFLNARKAWASEITGNTDQAFVRRLAYCLGIGIAFGRPYLDVLLDVKEIENERYTNLIADFYQHCCQNDQVSLAVREILTELDNEFCERFAEVAETGQTEGRVDEELLSLFT